MPSIYADSIDAMRYNVYDDTEYMNQCLKRR